MIDEKQAIENNDSQVYQEVYAYLLEKTKSWDGKGIDRESVAAISIFRALRKWEDGRRCSFRCFALTIMLNKLRDCHKRIKIENKYANEITEGVNDSIRQGRFAQVFCEAEPLYIE